MIYAVKYKITQKALLKDALQKMNELESDITLFVTDESDCVVGTITDGDVRRAILKGADNNTAVIDVMNTSFLYLIYKKASMDVIMHAKKKGVKVLPVLDENRQLNSLVNFSAYKSFLPVDAVIMAGGEGIRLRPLTEHTPKPLLKIGDRPILEHVINHLQSFGLVNIQISINYLGDQIVDYFGDGTNRGLSIRYIHEEGKLGTIGSVKNAHPFEYDDILLMNSDILTTIDLENFYLDFHNTDSDISIATIPIPVNIPYAVLDTREGRVTGLKEKPSFEFVGNAGIYLIKKKHLDKIPSGVFHATDFIELLINEGAKVSYYQLYDYWLDIGKTEDYQKAQRDIKHIRL